MAFHSSATSAKVVVDFNRVNIALARRQGLLASLMGVGSIDKPEGKPTARPDELVDFEDDPELLGVGGKIRIGGDVERQKLSSNDNLKRHLLGSDYDKTRRAKWRSPLDRPDVLAPGNVAGGKSLQQPPQKVAEDSDEYGRSSLGRRKKERLPMEEACVVVDEDDDVDEGMEQTLSMHSEPAKTAKSPSRQTIGTYLDEMLAKRSAKMRKKRNRQKRRREKQGNEKELAHEIEHKLIPRSNS